MAPVKKDMSGLSHLEPDCRGLIHLYVGDGKGKTTAAVGLAVRAAGQGKRVVFCQFMKGRSSGELRCLEQLKIQTLCAKEGTKFLFQMSPEERLREEAAHTQCLDRVHSLVIQAAADLIVLDEVVDADNCGLLRPGALLELLACRNGTELVLTGREPSTELEALADYHTLFTCVRHPYQKGISARKGIEY